MIHITMKGRPGIKKNGRRIFRKKGRTVNIPSEKYEAWKLEFMWLLKDAMKKEGVTAPINAPVNLKLVIYFKNHAHEPDLSNSYQGIEDCLEEVGIISNDKLIYSHDGSRKVFGKTSEDHFEVFLSVISV